MNNNLKFEKQIQVTQPKLPNITEYIKYVEEIWDNKWLTNNGPVYERLQSSLKTYLETDSLELFTNGHLALEIAIKALDLQGEVITTPFTFASTTHAIVNCGLKPVFCDIDEQTYNIDVNKIEKCITKKTTGIVAVHVFGTPCNFERIQEIADKYNLKIIYDAAHAFGVKVNNEPIGNFGDVSMFSMHATKVFHSIEGGILTYKDKNLQNKLQSLKNFGQSNSGSVDYIGTNAKMNEFQAAMGLCNLDSIDEDIKNRKKLHETYSEYLQNEPRVVCLNKDSDVKHNYAYFPILLENQKQRDLLQEQLKKYNVVARKYFYPLTNSFECYDYNPNVTPIALEVSKRVLCLPLYSELEVKDVKKIASIILHELGDLDG